MVVQERVAELEHGRTQPVLAAVGVLFDELLSFELAVDGTSVAGRARVMREERQNVYALCFEELGDEATHMLLRLVARG